MSKRARKNVKSDKSRKSRDVSEQSESENSFRSQHLHEKASHSTEDIFSQMLSGSSR